MKRFTLIWLVCFVSLQARATENQIITRSDEFTSQVRLINHWIRELMDFYHIPGVAVGVVYDQNLVWSQGFGHKNVTRKTFITTRTLFRIASISKLFTSTAIMQLRDQHKLALDDPIKKYLPWFEIQNKFKNSPEITIRHLLTHTSGLPAEAAFPYWTDHKFPELAEIIKTLPDQEMIFPPETRFKYSNLGMALLGEIVVQVSRLSYEQYITQNILNPLKMEMTRVQLTKADLPHLATGYLRFLPGKPRKIADFIDSKGITPAANLSSTIVDLAKFCALQFRTDNTGGEQILKSSTLKEMQRVHWLRSHWKSGWGLGFSIQRTDERVLVGHSGWVAGYRSQILFSPKEKVAVIVLINTEDYHPAKIARKMLELITPVILKQAPTETKPVVFNPLWKKYVGRYKDTSDWQTDVLILNRKLHLFGYNYPPEANPTNNLTELIPAGKDTFRMSGLNGNGERVIFMMEKEAQIKAIKIGENYVYPVD